FNSLYRVGCILHPVIECAKIGRLYGFVLTALASYIGRQVRAQCIILLLFRIEEDPVEVFAEFIRAWFLRYQEIIECLRAGDTVVLAVYVLPDVGFIEFEITIPGQGRWDDGGYVPLPVDVEFVRSALSCFKVRGRNPFIQVVISDRDNILQGVGWKVLDFDSLGFCMKCFKVLLPVLSKEGWIPGYLVLDHFEFHARKSDRVGGEGEERALVDLVLGVILALDGYCLTFDVFDVEVLFP